MRNGDALVRLSAGDLVLTLAPHIGGSVAGFTKSGADLMRRTPPEALEKGIVRQTSAFPLVPYSNRIAHGRFSFGGEHELARNAGEEHALHGNGWQLPWSVADASTSSCRLVLEHSPFGCGPGGSDGWPFAFRATQSFTLEPRGLRVALSLENVDTRPMPAGLGWHPFFPLRPDTVLAFSASGMWMTGPDHLSTEHVAVTSDRAFDGGRRVECATLNNCFTGWRRRARIELGGGLPTLRFAADELFSMAIVYTPAGQSFFAFEPVSHMPDAVNRMDFTVDHGLRILAPGETIAGHILLAVG
ncbi:MULTISPECIES: aldose 1-epimerase [unclassified Sinorhizobium]|uniref:aldose 1-epimerase n=1 Tax=unclassified Sinorhizobium TaxID=2613772 RepID=UPI0024C235E7|nr:MULTISPECIES: aldose 1-epimerase [unclassified Sinorhizobium]MDK1377301.1 aldose 1-epimerase [Sinorhizobium sp. 6-70]MDK1481576.1 aldose 1-epimerase [Sinorhizobium sp. 6-117]